jgi:hypothetical protein
VRNNSRVWVFGGLAVVVVIAVVVALVAGGGDDDGGGESTAAQETAGVSVDGARLPEFPGNGEVDEAVGEPLPTLTGEDFDARAVTVAPDGSPQVVMVLIHSCPHCQAEVPRVVALADEGVFDGVTVTAVPTNTSEQAPNYPPSSWLEREKWPFPVLLDDANGIAAGTLGTTGVPFFVFVDADGNVAGRATGEIDSADLTQIVEALKAGEELPLPGADGGSTSTR